MSDYNELSEEEQKIVDDIMKEGNKEESRLKPEGNSSVKSQEEAKVPEKKETGFIAFYKRYMFLISIALGAIFIAINVILDEKNISFVREIPLLMYAIVAFGIFFSIFRLIRKISNTIVKIIVGILHIGFWIGVSLIAYIIIALIYPSGTDTIKYDGKTYVRNYGLFGYSSYYEKINPFMVSSDSVDYSLEADINRERYKNDYDE